VRCLRRSSSSPRNKGFQNCGNPFRILQFYERGSSSKFHSRNWNINGSFEKIRNDSLTAADSLFGHDSDMAGVWTVHHSSLHPRPAGGDNNGCRAAEQRPSHADHDRQRAPRPSLDHHHDHRGADDGLKKTDTSQFGCVAGATEPNAAAVVDARRQSASDPYSDECVAGPAQPDADHGPDESATSAGIELLATNACRGIDDHGRSSDNA
jgi:hypothetical protein